MAVHARPHTLTSPPPAVSMQQGARQGGMSTSLDALAFGSLSSFSLTGASPSQMRNGCEQLATGSARVTGERVMWQEIMWLTWCDVWFLI